MARELPKYRRRPDRDTAFAEFRGRRYPFPGKFDSPESLAAYNQFILWVLATQQAEEQPPPPPPAAGLVTIAELVTRYLDYAEQYYRKNGRPSDEYHVIRSAVRPLYRLKGNLYVNQFGPLALKEVRQAMISGSYLRKEDKGRPWSRNTINKQIHRIRSMFRWGVEHELVPQEIHQALLAIASLREGKTDAAETEEVQPVEQEVIDATLPYTNPVVADMVRVQNLVGMRPENLCLMRACDIDRSREIWLYRPPRHKTKSRGKKLTIAIGPQAQKILQPYLDSRPAEAYLFSPAEAEQWRSEQRRAERRSPMTPSQAARQKAAKPQHPPRTHYDTDSYRKAVQYAIAKGNRTRAEEAKKRGQKPPPAIPQWSPNQLRHSAGTRARKHGGIEGAQVFLGHSHAKTTEIYAERDLELAEDIAREIG